MVVVELLGLMFLPTAVIACLTHLPALASLVTQAVERVHPHAPQPTGPPIEQISADLRRISAHLDAQVSAVRLPGRIQRVRATMAAYDQVLLSACRALEVDPAGTETPMSSQDRLQTEAALAAAGMRW
ncbi:MAG: hypothetical protein M3O55_04345 [Actinomycetota bacterium]|nr:hypothetical protein [Actinomycetota bacterium]